MSNSVIEHKNFITNSQEIIDIAESEADKFQSRGKGERYEFANERYGPCVMESFFDMYMSDRLKEAILKTIDKKKWFDNLMPDEIVLNRYKPGCFLPKHVDAFGMYWKFMLCILRSDKPHLKLYDEDHPEGFYVDESPGTYIEMPISMAHEVTQIEENENFRYSVVFIWKI